MNRHPNMSASLDPVTSGYAGTVMSVSVIRSTPSQPLYRHLAPIRGLPPDMHQPKNKLKTLNPLIKLLCKIQTPHLMTLAKIKTLFNHLLQILKPSPLMIKVNLPVKTGTQMIKMIK